jgi:DNA-directed RNA polymerase sigma subunit (sigma70/sigma32)
LNTNEIRFYLHNYDNLEKEINHLSAQLAEYRHMNISGIKAQVISDMPIHHSNTSRTESMALSRLECIQDLENEIDSKMRLFRAINSVYYYLKEPVKSIIEMRYMEEPQGRAKYTWAEIAGRLNITEKYCRKIDCKVIRKIQIALHTITDKKSA